MLLLVRRCGRRVVGTPGRALGCRRSLWSVPYARRCQDGLVERNCSQCSLTVGLLLLVPGFPRASEPRVTKGPGRSSGKTGRHAP